MHHADIIAALVKAGHPPSRVADDLDVSKAAVSMVIRGKRTSSRIARHISKKTRTPVNTLFPDGRYDARRNHTRGKAAA